MNISMSKKQKMTAAILAIVVIAYNVTLFVLCGFAGYTGVFWTSWVFMLAAFVAMAVAGVLLGEKGMFLRDWLFGYPIVKHTTVYITFEFIASTLFIIFEQKIKWGWAFAVQFLLLSVYGVCAISCFLAKETIDDIHTKVGNKTEFWKLLRVDADMLMEKCSNAELKTQLGEFSEAVRYSDPMSSDTLRDLEKEIASTVSDCDNAVTRGDVEQAEALCKKAKLLLVERNKKCKALN